MKALPPSDEGIEFNMKRAQAAERDKPVATWWLSFASETEHLGVMIVRARGVLSGIEETIRSGRNPGGSVCAGRLPRDVDPSWYGRLLDEEDQDRFWAELEKEDNDA